MEIVLGGNPLSSIYEIVDRTSMSTELETFVLSVVDYLYNTDGIQMNQVYQQFIIDKVDQTSELQSSVDKTKAKRMLALLSYSADFWLPKKYCGQGNYSLVFDEDLDADVTSRRAWLTVFADIMSHDMAGAVGTAMFAPTPPTVAAGAAATSAGRAVSIAWDTP